MKKNIERKNHRLKDFDYGTYGYYFVTICTYNKEKLLSSIVASDAPVAQNDLYERPVKVQPTLLGEKVIECWKNIEKLNKNVSLDKFVLMPNHIHGIIKLENSYEHITIKKKYSFEIIENENHRSIQGLIKDFKSVTTRFYKKNFNSNHSLWQSSFYDEVIISEAHYESIANYIINNPLK
ncbi:transposase [Ruminococcus sp.]|uniref:transposase n=1 Tax=Ruminococcus sp. TaxID=41978 RepID=UPI0025CD0186|nr:transposase [Ruminococcus sp.]MCI6615687.1 hypothetical protein [Ruminococcus sp.]